MVIAFDFDGVLSNLKMQQFARKCMRSGIDVWVVTARREGEHNQDLHKVLLKIGLTLGKVIFTDSKEKIDYLKGINADLFIDDNSTEFNSIMDYTDTIPVWFTSK